MLPLHTVVGGWRVVARTGCGTFGAVYRAVPAHDEHALPVALKLALRPADPRFAREAELLSRCHHPSIPRLLEHGSWHSPAGTRHPFLIMQWVDGVPLYEQVRLHPSEPFHVRRWLMQLAQALAVVHEQGIVHRDLKGDNVLVSRADSRAMLMDFGTGTYPGAAALTSAMEFPGTPLYRSPQSWFFEVRFYGSATEVYRPSAADDLYALGVTACRLLTGEYPELEAPNRDEQGTLHAGGVLLPRALMRSPHVDPALRALTLRLLSVQPEQRGTAAQLAQELESTFRPARPSSSTVASTSSETQAPPRREGRRRALVAVALALIIGMYWALPDKPAPEPKPAPEHAVARAESSREDSADAGTSGLGDATTSMAVEKAPIVSLEEGLGEDTLPELVPDQMRPDAKGRCPLKGPVALNGGCWWGTTEEPEKCQEFGGQMFKGTCYMPVMPPGRKRPPTSGPMKTP
ncbi:MAG: serine/threonine-protein kinase [Hyalangium sp.]|uniref:serine/threonine-protein kinase n=1 Tax=Hyalangium sp. TaxID=2028555 RepID=UPI00389ABFCE